MCILLKKINIKIEVDDDFKSGQCWDCPFSYDESYDDDGYIETELCCIFYNDCPIP